LDLAIDAQCATALFRIFQETLANIARRAGVDRVRIVLSQDRDHLTLEIRDNGHGMGEDQLSTSGMLAILGMRERAALLGGEFTIAGDHGSGTTVRVRIPVAGRQPAVASQ
jgi:signal transduction histidine kinase